VVVVVGASVVVVVGAAVDVGDGRVVSGLVDASDEQAARATMVRRAQTPRRDGTRSTLERPA
jgi:hypothetical protein